MRNILLLFMVLLTFSCHSQDTVILTVSPVINQEEPDNQKIITTLVKFLNSKNTSLTQNDYWLKSDFERYGYPYADIYAVENGKLGKNFYQPTLMAIIPTALPHKWIVKIAYIGHNNQTKENQLRTIYNLIAQEENGKIVFSKYLDFATRNWTMLKEGAIAYRISPLKKPNLNEVNAQKTAIEKLCRFFKTDPIPVTYYSCITPKELFEIKGFDYNPMMYEKSGGMVEYGNHVFSGNNAEIYTHEMVHVYTGTLFPDKDAFLDEGLATYIAGSGTFDYTWHRNKFRTFLEKNPDFKIAERTNPYEKHFLENETPVPYVTAALICERTIRLFGKEKLFSMLKQKADLWELLKATGLTQANINSELRKEILLPFTDIVLK